MQSVDARCGAQDFEATSFAYVDTTAALRAMARRLAGARELAVDLEHHSHRTYQVLLEQASKAALLRSACLQQGLQGGQLAQLQPGEGNLHRLLPPLLLLGRSAFLLAKR
jgi:hypothetical protein